MLVFDKWTCNTNGRQAIFFRTKGERRYYAQMIDQGFCFNAGQWNFPDAPLRGLYARHHVYATVRGIDAFEPWIARIETKITEAVLGEIAGEIPPEWYDAEADALEKMLEQLARRRKLPGNRRCNRSRIGSDTCQKNQNTPTSIVCCAMHRT
jgi:hypothetical protein